MENWESDEWIAKKCECCGGIFYPEYRNTKYCSPACSMRAHHVLRGHSGRTKRPPTDPAQMLAWRKKHLKRCKKDERNRLMQLWGMEA